MMYYLLSMGFGLTHVAADVETTGMAPPHPVAEEYIPTVIPGSDDFRLRRSRVAGGSFANPGEVPFQVSLHRNTANDPHICGGSLISKTWVLTSAACVSPDGILTPSDELFVRVGGTELQGSRKGDAFSIKRIIPHPGFNSETFENDIALIELAKPANGHKPIPLAGPDMDGASMDYMSVATSGWGEDTNGYSPNSLRVTYWLNVVPLKTCADYYKDLYYVPTDGSVVCAGGPMDGFGSCYGDAGNPLFMITRTWGNGIISWKQTQVGVTSWGASCGKKRLPAVYTSVGHYANWIMETTTKPDFVTVEGTTDDLVNVAKCPDGYTITGCTCNSSDKDCHAHWVDFAGASRCLAQNEQDASGVRAYAICGRLSEADMTHVTGAPSPLGDDAPSKATCPEDYELTGCSYWGSNKSADGGKFKGNSCLAYNSFGGEGAMAQARCGKIPSASDFTEVKSELSAKEDNAEARATCPEGSTLTGCTCYSPWHTCNGSIPDSETNTCVAYNWGTKHGVYAYARCAKFSAN